jgi:basic amino acid/polyamine antiporter, APA family
MSALTESGHRPLTMGMATALVVGNMIGSGVFTLPAALAAFGTSSLVAWLFTSAGAFLLALVFSRLAHAYPRTGGPYAYSRRAFGDFVGFQTAWGYWIAAWLGNAAIAIAFVGYLGHFWSTLAGTSTSQHVVQALVAVGAVWLLTWVNVRGIREAGLVQTVTTVLKVVPLAAIAIVGLFWIDTANFGPFNPTEQSAFGAITAAATLTLWAFIGLESATIPAEHVVDPERNLPRATLWGTLTATAIYVLGTVTVMGVIPQSVLAESTAPFAEAATQMWGTWAGNAVALAAVIATFGCLNGWILLQGQMPFAAARDRLFPAAFGRLNRHGVPAVGLVASSVLLTLFMIPNFNSGLVDRFTEFILLATTTTLVAYLYGAAAQLMLLVTDRARFSGRRLAVDVVVGALAFAYAAWTIGGSGYQATAWVFFLLIAGIPVYLWTRHQRQRSTTESVGSPEPVDLAEKQPQPA